MDQARTAVPGTWRLSTLEAASIVAAALVTIGVAIPTVMMVDGAVRLDITYHWWAWAGLPATLVPGAASALLLRAIPGLASLVLFLAGAFGVALFWPEYGAFTFGPVAVIAGLVYAREMTENFVSSGSRGLPPHPPQ